jgi:hypothetical protein
MKSMESVMAAYWTAFREWALVSLLLLLINGASVGLAAVVAMKISPI